MQNRAAARVRKPWIPAFAGMTSFFSAIPAKAGIQGALCLMAMSDN
jgi:hypothetical protein